MYLDPRNQITGGFGGVKRVDFGKREKKIEDLKKQLDEERVKIPQNPLNTLNDTSPVQSGRSGSL